MQKTETYFNDNVFLQGTPGPMGPPGDPGKEGTPVCTSNSISRPSSKSNRVIRRNAKTMSKILRKN